jgi:hypothetical protein
LDHCESRQLFTRSAMTGYFIESLIMSVAIQFNFQVFSTNASMITTFPARSFFPRGKAKKVSPHF